MIPKRRLIACVLVDATDPAVAALPAPLRQSMGAVTISPGYTETTCTSCSRAVYIGPVQRSRADREPAASVVCYLCVDPNVLLVRVSQPGA